MGTPLSFGALTSMLYLTQYVYTVPIPYYHFYSTIPAACSSKAAKHACANINAAAAVAAADAEGKGHGRRGGGGGIFFGIGGREGSEPTNLPPVNEQLVLDLGQRHQKWCVQV